MAPPGSGGSTSEDVMDLEFHQIELRYESLRRTSAERERRLCGSLAEIGQQTPVVVVAGGDGGRHVLLDGYKRVRALLRLRRDTVRAVCWELSEMEALLLERLMRTTEGDSPLEQGWLLRELRDHFHLGLPELARRFDKSPSWVSRRLALVGELPAAQFCPHIDQHRVHEAGIVVLQPSRCVLPPQIEGEPVHRLAVAQALNALQHHHHRHDPGRHRCSPNILEQVGEGFIRKQPVSFAVQ
jgi:hypothetical protein